MGKYVLPIPEDSISYCRIDPSSSPAKAMGVYLELDLEADPPAVSIEHTMQIDGIPMRVWHGRADVMSCPLSSMRSNLRRT